MTVARYPPQREKVGERQIDVRFSKKNVQAEKLVKSNRLRH